VRAGQHGHSGGPPAVPGLCSTAEGGGSEAAGGAGGRNCSLLVRAGAPAGRGAARWG
jgi:hypothetical protein